MSKESNPLSVLGDLVQEIERLRKQLCEKDMQLAQLQDAINKAGEDVFSSPGTVSRT